MSFPSADTPIVPETDCAICGEPVYEEHMHMQWAVHFPRPRIGRVHSRCVPPQGMATWMEERFPR